MINHPTKIFLISIILLHAGTAGEPKRPVSVVFRSLSADSIDRNTANGQTTGSELRSRQTTALIYSLAVPGSGQTYLGEPYKGVAITLTAFGSVITSIISHNNFIARNERLDALEFQYSIAPSWETADIIYAEMQSAHRIMKQDSDRRNLFIVITAVVWTLNIVDVLYNTDDHGEALFSGDSRRFPVTGLAGIDTPHTPLMSLSLPLE